MKVQVTFDELIDSSQRDRAIYLGFRAFLRPLAKDNRFAGLLRGVCCAWCRECEQRLIDADSVNALRIIEEFSRGKAGADALSFARNLARKAARRVARRTKGKTKEYWASHAVCEAARNDAFESLVWTSHATFGAGLYLDRKLELFKEVLEGQRSVAPAAPPARQRSGR
jgi:hypothetical protein